MSLKLIAIEARKGRKKKKKWSRGEGGKNLRELWES